MSADETINDDFPQSLWNTGIPLEEHQQAMQRVKPYKVIIPLSWEFDEYLEVRWKVRYECYASNDADAHRIGQMFVKDCDEQIAESLRRTIDENILSVGMAHCGVIEVEQVEDHESQFDDIIDGVGVTYDRHR